jgi:hypothetical protein
MLLQSRAPRQPQAGDTGGRLGFSGVQKVPGDRGTFHRSPRAVLSTQALVSSHL